MQTAKAAVRQDHGRVDESPATLASRVYGELRGEIIAGRHAPGRKLRIQALCERFGVGLSPMREALTRLSRDGLVKHADQRGFSVARLDLAHLDELVKTRCWFNEIGLRESIANGDDRWEEAILLAYHRLSKLPRYVAAGAGEDFNPAWEEAHRAFHTSLIAACGSRWLIEYCEQLFDAADFYRNVSRVSLLRRKLRQTEHERIAKAVLARDAALAVELMVLHVRRTAALVRERLARDADDGVE